MNPNTTAPKSALAMQEGGSHYKDLAIQPVEYIHANGIPFAEGNVIKYVTRWRSKNGIADLRKARHTLDLLIELETKKAKSNELDEFMANLAGEPAITHTDPRHPANDAAAPVTVRIPIRDVATEDAFEPSRPLTGRRYHP